MDWYSFEGKFNLPDETTKKEMIALYEKFKEYIEDYEDDYFDPLFGNFCVDVLWDEDAVELTKFLKLVKENNFELTDV